MCVDVNLHKTPRQIFDADKGAELLPVELAGVHGACLLLGGLRFAAALLLGLLILPGIQRAIKVFLEQAAVRTDHGQDGVHVVLGVCLHLQLRAAGHMACATGCSQRMAMAKYLCASGSRWAT